MYLHKKKDEHPALKRKKSIGNRASDALTKFVGSWTFILLICALIIVWIGLNLLGFMFHWDPWPFIILNLVLSCLAALQAPIILMSQNRAGERDRATAKYDYQVNRKAEREIANMQEDLEEIKRLIRKKKK